MLYCTWYIYNFVKNLLLKLKAKEKATVAGVYPTPLSSSSVLRAATTTFSSLSLKRELETYCAFVVFALFIQKTEHGSGGISIASVSRTGMCSSPRLQLPALFHATWLLVMQL